MRIGALFDVPILLSPWWNILVAVFGGIALFTTGPMFALIVILAFCVIYLLFILVHEFGHVLMAKHYGYDAEAVYIYPMGGLACTYSVGRNPREAFWIAAAGPLTNVAWCLLLFPFASHPILRWAFIINIALLLFNLLPIYPMDGGRIFKAIMQMIFKVGELRAATITFWTGVAVGVPIAIWMLFYGIIWGASIILCASLLWGWQHLKQERAMDKVRQFNRGFGARQAGQYAPEVRRLVNEAYDVCERAEDILRRTRKYVRRD